MSSSSEQRPCAFLHLVFPFVSETPSGEVWMFENHTVNEWLVLCQDMFQLPTCVCDVMIAAHSLLENYETAYENLTTENDALKAKLNHLEAKLTTTNNALTAALKSNEDLDAVNVVLTDEIDLLKRATISTEPAVAQSNSNDLNEITDSPDEGPVSMDDSLPAAMLKPYNECVSDAFHEFSTKSAAEKQSLLKEFFKLIKQWTLDCTTKSIAQRLRMTELLARNYGFNQVADEMCSHSDCDNQYAIRTYSPVLDRLFANPFLILPMIGGNPENLPWFKRGARFLVWSETAWACKLSDFTDNRSGRTPETPLLIEGHLTNMFGGFETTVWATGETLDNNGVDETQFEVHVHPPREENNLLQLKWAMFCQIMFPLILGTLRNPGKCCGIVCRDDIHGIQLGSYWSNSISNVGVLNHIIGHPIFAVLTPINTWQRMGTPTGRTIRMDPQSTSPAFLSCSQQEYDNLCDTELKFANELAHVEFFISKMFRHELMPNRIEPTTGVRMFNHPRGATEEPRQTGKKPDTATHHVCVDRLSNTDKQSGRSGQSKNSTFKKRAPARKFENRNNNAASFAEEIRLNEEAISAADVRIESDRLNAEEILSENSTSTETPSPDDEILEEFSKFLDSTYTLEKFFKDAHAESGTTEEYNDWIYPWSVQGDLEKEFNRIRANVQNAQANIAARDAKKAASEKPSLTSQNDRDNEDFWV